MKKKAYLAIFPLLVFLVLGGLNIYKKITWKEPTDGVYWKKKPAGLVAVKIEINSPGYLADLKKGDILYSINSEPIRNKIDIAKNLWIAGTTQKVIYQINRQGELIYPSFHLTQKRINLIYFLLALIGLTTLIIGIIVFLNSKKPFTMPFVYFYFLSLAFYSFYIFSPTGEMNTLDSVFYWLDRTAFLVFPPLLLHFFFIFPQPGVVGNVAGRAVDLPFDTLPDAELLRGYQAAPVGIRPGPAGMVEGHPLRGVALLAEGPGR